MNHVNFCVLCVCLLFNFCLFIVINLSFRVLFAQHIQRTIGKHLTTSWFKTESKVTCLKFHTQNKKKKEVIHEQRLIQNLNHSSFFFATPPVIKIIKAFAYPIMGLFNFFYLVPFLSISFAIYKTNERYFLRRGAYSTMKPCSYKYKNKREIYKQ